MNSRVITGSTGVWLTKYSDIGPEELIGADDENVIRGVQFSSRNMAPEWTRIGEAQVTITLTPNDEIITGKVASLRDEQTKVVAEAQKRSTEIERQIQTLLAITFEVPA